MSILKTTFVAATMLALCSGAPLMAQDDDVFETSIVKDKDEVFLDPDKAYILLQTSVAVPVTFFRVPSEADKAKNADERAEAYEKARGKWEKKMARYEKNMAAFKKGGRSRKPIKPAHLSEATFGWPAPEQSLMVSLGPFNRFDKGKDNSLYLQEVPAGEYVFYGTVSMGLGACACMGTVKFDADAGKITTLRYDGVWLDEKGGPLGRDKPPEGVKTNDALVRVAMIIEPADEAALDPRLPADWIVPADLTVMPFVPNWYGAEINRLRPIEGVLAYDRDRAIDVKAEMAKKAEQEAAEEAARKAAEAEADAAEAAAAAMETATDAADESGEAATDEAEVATE